MREGTEPRLLYSLSAHRWEQALISQRRVVSAFYTLISRERLISALGVNPWLTDSRGEKRVEVRLAGGLGNQLFQFAAGWEIAERLGAPLYMNTSGLSKSGTPRKFELEEVVQGVASWGADSTSRRLFAQKGFSYDENVLKVRNGTLLQGYFQSPKFFSSTNTVVLDLIRKSDAFNRGEMVDVQPFLALQIRRGDYLKTQNQRIHGIVPEEFFLRALEFLRKIHGALDVIVFSDDANTAERLAKEIPRAFAHHPPTSESPLQTLGLLSKASGFAISNSSFGWWGAFLAGAQSTVIVPRPWFKDLALNTRDLFPEKWLSLGIGHSCAGKPNFDF